MAEILRLQAFEKARRIVFGGKPLAIELSEGFGLTDGGTSHGGSGV